MTPPRTPHVNLSGSEHGAARPHGIEPVQDLGRPGQFNIGESCLCETGCSAWGLLSLKRNSKHTALPEASRGLVTDVHPNWVWVFRVQDLIRQKWQAVRFVRIVMGRASSIYAAHKFGVFLWVVQIACAGIGALLLSALRGTRSLKRVGAAQLNAIGLLAALRRSNG